MVGSIVKGITLTLICLAVLFPLYTVVLTSISTQPTITDAGGLVIIPGELTTAAYRQILSGASSPAPRWSRSGSPPSARCCRSPSR